MKEIEDSITETISKSDLTNLSADYGEVLIDSFLKDGFLKEIPIIGTVLGLGKLGFAINDYIFLKKMLGFLSNIKQVPKEKREKMIQKIESSENYQKNVGQTLLLIINKHDDFEKPKVIGKIFSAFLNEEIDYEMFLRLSNSIDRIFLPDLQVFINAYNGGILPYEIQGQFASVGLMSPTRTGDLRIGGGNEYYFSEYGICLIQIFNK